MIVDDLLNSIEIKCDIYFTGATSFFILLVQPVSFDDKGKQNYDRVMSTRFALTSFDNSARIDAICHRRPFNPCVPTTEHRI